MARILVIDDDPGFRELLTEALAGAGHEVVCAPDGKVGMNLYYERQADIVLTDMIMPEKDGVEVICEIRRDYPDTKVIAFSGGATLGPYTYLQMAHRLGAARVFAKPFKMRDLMDAINTILNGQASDRDSQEAPVADLKDS